MERLQSAPNSAKKLHKERNRAYARKADIIIIAEDKSPKKIAKEILKALKGQKWEY